MFYWQTTNLVLMQKLLRRGFSHALPVLDPRTDREEIMNPPIQGELTERHCYLRK